MRAAVLHAYGEPPVVEDFADPEGALSADVLAGAINPIDLRMASGTLAGRKPPLPSVAGSEGIARLADGRRVYFSHALRPHGSLAERTLLEEDGLVEVPDGVDDAHAVAFGIAGLAAWLALERRAGLRAGETVLVLGASGVVGLIAVQAARLQGAARVVAAARSEPGLRRATEVGADAVVRLDGTREQLTAAFREAADGEVDVVFDPLWGEPAAAAVQALAFRGRLVQLGQSAGADATLPSVAIRFKELSIIGHTNFSHPPDAHAEALRRMWGHAAAGELRVDVETVPLDGAPGAWQRQAGSPGVKLVVVP